MNGTRLPAIQRVTRAGEHPAPPLEERCRISASKLIEAWAMAMKPERRKAFEAALDSLKEDELRALEGLTVVRMEHKDIEMIAHAMGEIVRLKIKERGII
jgi:hypothetical protein